MGSTDEFFQRDPWAILDQVRTQLSSDPVEVDFVQTYLPMGFSAGDQESGTMALLLPDCLRWNYLEPFPKAFLLCNETAHAWNPGENTGRRYQVDTHDQASLDLLRLSTGHLRERYSATVDTTSENEAVIELIPKTQGGQIKSAKIVLAPTIDRLIKLEFIDGDGNLTRFELTNHRPLVANDAFTAPNELTWLEN